MNPLLTELKWGLALVLLGLGFGIFLGIDFGVNEDAIRADIASGIAAHPTPHDAKSRDLVPIKIAAVIKLRALVFGDVRAATNTEITP